MSGGELLTGERRPPRERAARSLPAPTNRWESVRRLAFFIADIGAERFLAEIRATPISSTPTSCPCSTRGRATAPSSTW